MAIIGHDAPTVKVGTSNVHIDIPPETDRCWFLARGLDCGLIFKCRVLGDGADRLIERYCSSCGDILRRTPWPEGGR